MAGCYNYLKKQYVCNPKLRMDFRESYMKNVTISTLPTELGS
jgi:hypothetical protein